MTLPRYQLPEEEEDVDMDSTAPAQFVLKLPKSFARKLAQPPSAPMAFTPFTPSAPWTVDESEPIEQPKPARGSGDRAGLVALVASIIAGVLVLMSVGAAAAAGHGPVGIAHRAPKSLVRHVRSSDRRTGVAPRVQATTVSIESLAHPRHRHRSPRHHPRR